MLDSSLITKTSTARKQLLKSAGREPLSYWEDQHRGILPFTFPLRRMCLPWYSYTISVCFAGWLAASMSCHPSPKERAAESHAQLCTPHMQTRKEGYAFPAEMHLANTGCLALLTSPRKISPPDWDGERLRHVWRLEQKYHHQRPGDFCILLVCHQGWLTQPCTAMIFHLCSPVWDSAFFTRFNCQFCEDRLLYAQCLAQNALKQKPLNWADNIRPGKKGTVIVKDTIELKSGR